jgi:hypothetical protein
MIQPQAKIVSMIQGLPDDVSSYSRKSYLDKITFLNMHEAPTDVDSNEGSVSQCLRKRLQRTPVSSGNELERSFVALEGC